MTDDKKPASAGRDWRDEVADNNEFWLLEDSGGQVRVIYDPPPDFFQMQTIHVVRAEALREVEEKFEASQETVGKLAKRITELEADLLSQARVNKVLSDEVLIYMKERDAALAEVERLLESIKDEGQAELRLKASERDRYKLALEKLDEWQGKQACEASVYTIDNDEFALMQHLIHDALKGGGE